MVESRERESGDIAGHAAIDRDDAVFFCEERGVIEVGCRSGDAADQHEHEGDGGQDGSYAALACLLLDDGLCI